MTNICALEQRLVEDFRVLIRHTHRSRARALVLAAVTALAAFGITELGMQISRFF